MTKYLAHAEATRATIRAALEALLEERDFEDVTVAALAERAGMNRSTIYRYYSSLYEVLGDCIYQYAGKADQKVPQAGDPDFWEVVSANYANSARDIAEHGKLYSLLQRYPSKFPSDPPHVAVVRGHSREYYRLLVDQLVLMYPACRMPHAYLEAALESVSGSVMTAWVRGGCVESCEEYAEYVMVMCKAVVDAVMGPAPEPRDWRPRPRITPISCGHIPSTCDNTPVLSQLRHSCRFVV